MRYLINDDGAPFLEEELLSLRQKLDGLADAEREGVS